MKSPEGRGELSLDSNETILQMPLNLKMEDVEKQYISAVLNLVSWNKTHAAKRLGIGLKTLYRKISTYNLEESREKAEQ